MKGDFVNDAGDRVTDMHILQMCGGGQILEEGANVTVRLPDPSCLADKGVFHQVLYQPADRFWVFQGIESLIFLTLAGLCLVLALWWVRTRLT